MNLTRRSITEIARELRSNPTPAERMLWQYLRRRQFHGYKFLRQKPFVHEEPHRKKFFYIVDFYCAALHLVIELDGKHHEFQEEYDYQRDLVLKGIGVNVIRFRNEELRDMDKVFGKLEVFVGIEP